MQVRILTALIQCRYCSSFAEKRTCHLLTASLLPRKRALRCPLQSIFPYVGMATTRHHFHLQVSMRLHFTNPSKGASCIQLHTHAFYSKQVSLVTLHKCSPLYHGVSKVLTHHNLLTKQFYQNIYIYCPYRKRCRGWAIQLISTIWVFLL